MEELSVNSHTSEAYIQPSTMNRRGTEFHTEIIPYQSGEQVRNKNWKHSDSSSELPNSAKDNSKFKAKKQKEKQKVGWDKYDRRPHDTAGASSNSAIYGPGSSENTSVDDPDMYRSSF